METEQGEARELLLSLLMVSVRLGSPRLQAELGVQAVGLLWPLHRAGDVLCL